MKIYSIFKDSNTLRCQYYPKWYIEIIMVLILLQSNDVFAEME